MWSCLDEVSQSNHSHLSDILTAACENFKSIEASSLHINS